MQYPVLKDRMSVAQSQRRDMDFHDSVRLPSGMVDQMASFLIYKSNHCFKAK